MATYTQADRPLKITTPLGPDALLLVGLEGHEAVSRLFHFRLELMADNRTPIAFDRIVGQAVTVTVDLPGGGSRLVNGLVNRFSQGGRDDTFTRFRAEVVPQFWLWTKKSQSRIFQHLSVPDILKQVLAGLSVKYEFQGNYHPRDYCVQCRETDFNFASRLMEEEGIYYYFRHADGSHQLVVTDVPDQHPTLPDQGPVIYEELEGGGRDEARVTAWEKTQEVRSGRVTLWDHCFELPGKNLEAQQTILDGVAAGKVGHHLKVANVDRLEVYDYPGEYAQRFDGVDKGGGDQAGELPKIFEDNQRTAKVRMEQETAGALEVWGESNGVGLVPGFQFTLTRHFDADGPYLVTRVKHEARLGGNYRSGDGAHLKYRHRFTCIPAALPYRPPRVTPRPTIAGAQTATVVGPAGEEIFVDKYGRVKVQFHWDRQGKKDADSSCWIRVAQVWAGKGWGAFFWPRVGHEVVVVFEEGDPDQPLIVGSVYNADNMPPFPLPKKNMLGGIKSASLRGKASENYNGVVFIDDKGNEHLAIHSERHLSFTSEADKLFHSGRHKAEKVSSVSLLTVGSLPGAGGSGGGGGPDPYDAYPPPQAAGMFGLNGMVVYGENLQAVLGLNHQIALGSNLQVCINPGGLAAGVTGAPAAPGPTAFLGSGVGGNMQLTVGTSANFVLGRTYQITLGPAQITVNPGAWHPLSTKIVGVMSVIYALWMLCYGLAKENDSDTNAFRSMATLMCQAMIDLLLVLLMQQEMVYYAAENETDNVLAKDKNGASIFQAAFKTSEGVTFESKFAGYSGWLTGLAILAAMVTPAAADIVTANRDKG